MTPKSPEEIVKELIYGKEWIFVEQVQKLKELFTPALTQERRRAEEAEKKLEEFKNFKVDEDSKDALFYQEKIIWQKDRAEKAEARCKEYETQTGWAKVIELEAEVAQLKELLYNARGGGS